MTAVLDMAPWLRATRQAELMTRVGRVRACQGVVVEAEGPDVFLGERCELLADDGAVVVAAEVVGFRADAVLLAPQGDVRGIRPGTVVRATGRHAGVAAGRALLGRVVDAHMQPLDGRPLSMPATRVPLHADAPSPLQRQRVRKVFETGVRVLDGLLTVGEGQRMGIFAGSGVGKSTLMGMIARHSTADVNVIALVGERGREVRDFVEDCLGPEGLSRSVVVVATSDQPALLRIQAAQAATAVAEHFRDAGQRVLLLMDSLTRLAMAQREVGIAAGEPPTARGYTPSVFASLPRLLERAGCGAEGSGSITAFYTVLVEGDDLDEPVADHARALLDGHIVLSRELAQEACYPPIDVLRSRSRLLRQIVDREVLRHVDEAVALMALHDNARDMIDFGAYRPGANPRLDRAVSRAPALRAFRTQPADAHSSRQQALADLAAALEMAT